MKRTMGVLLCTAVLSALYAEVPARAQDELEFETPRAYLDVYPGMPQQGQSAENVFGTSLTPVGGDSVLACGSGSISIAPLTQPDIILNVLEPSRVELFLTGAFGSSTNIGLVVLPENGDIYFCGSALAPLFAGFTPVFSDVLPVGEHGIWIGPLDGPAFAAQGGIYINVYEP